MLPAAQTSVLTITCVALLGLLGCTYDVDMPPDPCEITTAISYAGDILPILDTHCNGCHSGGAPSAGLDLKGKLSGGGIQQAAHLVVVSLDVFDWRRGEKMNMPFAGHELLAQC